MLHFRDISIRRKLTLLIVLISSVSLLIASIAFITTDRINTQQTVSNNLTSLADIIAANSSAALTARAAIPRDLVDPKPVIRHPPGVVL